MRAIDADLLEPDAEYDDGEFWAVSMSQIENAPTIEPERKMGRWIKLDMHAHLADHKCTACGQECYVPTCMGDPMYDFCPNCGADMREGAAE